MLLLLLVGCLWNGMSVGFWSYLRVGVVLVVFVLVSYDGLTLSGIFVVKPNCLVLRCLS